MKKDDLLTLVLSVSLLCMVGCATIPKEAPQLSAELGNRISAIEVSNITLLHRFFDQKRKEVDKFIETEWVPIFANEFFSNPTISAAWNTIVEEKDKSQRLQFIVRIGPKLQERINQKRLELIQPLDDLERRIEMKIRDEFAQALAINNSITSFLLSASKVAENRSRYLEKIGITEENIGEIVNKTDEAVSDLLKGSKEVQGKISAAEDFVNKLRAIRDSI